ncbi:hypothetical protein SDC9_116268 [bioreactor metagenome]|uniref:Uncharacterized protein n=1 Tax=bioreactor metagenome TaxID=1076179 RepID=A0A645C1U8_9ZZZZ
MQTDQCVNIKGIVVQKADVSAYSAGNTGEHGIAVRQLAFHETHGLQGNIKVRLRPKYPVGVGISCKYQRIPRGQYFMVRPKGGSRFTVIVYLGQELVD